MSLIDYEKARVDQVSSIYKSRTRVDVLRLDLLHSVVSGNKWFKLKEYLAEAKKLDRTVLSFGGAFSNHIVATAAAARDCGLKSIGIIRGEEPSVLSPTLKDAMHFGMKLFFSSREDYRNKMIPAAVYEQYSPDALYIINEGGYGPKGAEGAMGILELADAGSYTHIIAATGTGTMLAGLCRASTEEQRVLGIPVLKNNSLRKAIEDLLPQKYHSRFLLMEDYHFGGYAKFTREVFAFMNEWYRKTTIPSDFVYTGKLFFAVDDLIRKGYFPQDSAVLVVHSGGLQGNRSLPKGTLIF
jgi:1-aminocyclopropane-1-carboxylate deaminase